ncbi:hypothetical protein HETIRDRAFT_102140 [Heterobasidion irregulare TC 32-1]|uniref:Uncharacterized protein n=1 Tax=Heterobasidion irregulare (strain TC 32-1) TaxID=747525 RepID=W4K5K4_HETIT|nr:uncharacterized protein HETIRDRAFT_102140 [Heterobasidion irregulare TC 32-1]ETW81092.1 hypothetical protein HETIRDRAFT_102140 [Heterobasidion irregulare TC 32-1]
MPEEDEYSEEEDEADEASTDNPLISARPKPDCADSIHPPPPYTPIAPGLPDAHDFVPRCPIIRPPVRRTVPSERSIIHILYPFEARFHPHGGDALPTPDPSTNAHASASHPTHASCPFTTPILVDVPRSAARPSSSPTSDSSCDSDTENSTQDYAGQESATADPPPYTRFDLTLAPPMRPQIHSSVDASAQRASCSRPRGETLEVQQAGPRVDTQLGHKSPAESFESAYQRYNSIDVHTPTPTPTPTPTSAPHRDLPRHEAAFPQTTPYKGRAIRWRDRSTRRTQYTTRHFVARGTPHQSSVTDRPTDRGAKASRGRHGRGSASLGKPRRARESSRAARNANKASERATEKSQSAMRRDTTQRGPRGVPGRARTSTPLGYNYRLRFVFGAQNQTAAVGCRGSEALRDFQGANTFSKNESVLERKKERKKKRPRLDATRRVAASEKTPARLQAHHTTSKAATPPPTLPARQRDSATTRQLYETPVTRAASLALGRPDPICARARAHWPLERGRAGPPEPNAHTHRDAGQRPHRPREIDHSVYSRLGARGSGLGTRGSGLGSRISGDPRNSRFARSRRQRQREREKRRRHPEGQTSESVCSRGMKHGDADAGACARRAGRARAAGRNSGMGLVRARRWWW